MKDVAFFHEDVPPSQGASRAGLGCEPSRRPPAERATARVRVHPERPLKRAVCMSHVPHEFLRGHPKGRYRASSTPLDATRRQPGDTPQNLGDALARLASVRRSHHRQGLRLRISGPMRVHVAHLWGCHTILMRRPAPKTRAIAGLSSSLPPMTNSRRARSAPLQGGLRHAKACPAEVRNMQQLW